MQGGTDRAPAPPGGRVHWLYACAFLSGIAALCYEVVWARSFSLALGATRLATGAAVAGFLGGMAVGARAYPALRARVADPLKGYALLEAGIAVTALALTWLAPSLPRAFAWLAGDLDGGAALTALRFATAIALLLVPCALMGATFPALALAVVDSPGALGRRLGAVYGWNTLGAAAGALLAGLALTELLGARGTALVAAALNLMVAGAALALARGGLAAPAPEANATMPAPAVTRFPRGLIAATLLLSGFTTLAYEIVWFRALTYLFGNSTYAFAVMLFVFLAGLGAGSLLLGPIARRGATERAFALCQPGIAIAATAAIAMLAHVLQSPALEQHVSIFYRTVYGLPWWQRLGVATGVALVALLPPTVLMGLAFPLGASLFAGPGGARGLGRGLGSAAALANAGSILGALVAALLILPRLGSAAGTLAIAAINVGLGLAALRHIRTRPVTAVAGAAVVSLALGALTQDRLQFTVAGRTILDPELLFAKEGDLATVQVWRDRTRPDRMGMAIDGTIIGATRTWGDSPYRKQVFLAHLPFALEPRAASVMTVGLGSGSTLEALLAHPGVAHAEVVEINAPVAEACLLFPESRALIDPRATLVVEDAIHHLQRTDRRWDVIVSDGKLAQSFSGNSKLLTREYYGLCADHLTDRGVFVQWMPLAITPDELGVITRTMAATFPHVGLFFEPPANLVFTGARQPLAGRPRAEDAAIDGTRVPRDLAALGIPGMDGLRARWVADGPALLAAVGPGPVNTWDRPRLEFLAYRSAGVQYLGGGAQVLELLQRAEALAAASPDAALVATPEGAGMSFLRAALAAALAGDMPRAGQLAAEARGRSPADGAVAYWADRLQTGAVAAAR